MSEQEEPASSERAARIACALHGRRTAGPDELACDDCGTVVCETCKEDFRGLAVCAPCRQLEEEQEQDFQEQAYEAWVAKQEQLEREEDAYERQAEWERKLDRNAHNDLR